MRARVTVSVRDVIIIFIGLSVPSYYIYTYMMGNGYKCKIIFKDIDDTVTKLSFSTAGHRQYYMGQRRITHTLSHKHPRTIKFPVRRSLNLSSLQVTDVYKSIPPANGRHGAPHERINFFQIRF